VGVQLVESRDPKDLAEVERFRNALMDLIERDFGKTRGSILIFVLLDFAAKAMYDVRPRTAYMNLAGAIWDNIAKHTKTPS